MESQLQQCIDIVKEWVGQEYLYLDSPIQVKFSPHQAPVSIWALSVSPDAELYIMDEDEAWFAVQATDGADDLVIASIYQRLMWMGRKYAKAG